MDNNDKPKLSDLMDAAKSMQSNMKKAQEELTNLRVTGKSGAGDTSVEVTVNGRHETLSVHLGNDVLDEDKQTMEDLIAAACNDANKRVEKASQEKLMGLAEGFQLPEGMVPPKEGDEE